MDNLSTGYSALNLPFSPEAEQSVLGAILLDSSCLDRVAEILPRPDYFYQTNNGLIYGAMLDMFTLGKPVDFVTVLKLKSREFDDEQEDVLLQWRRSCRPSAMSRTPDCPGQ
ncbi:MAG: DnaB-like helicase N-terminal domain-containing protein [Anaeromassilibacillus sp.]